MSDHCVIEHESGIPEYLWAGASGALPPPPVATVAQELPFDQLRWEDFERLCLRLARYAGTPEHVQLYGTRGQAQGGIDIYARERDGSYAVYQCKRYTTLRAIDVHAAVSRFLEGEWADRAARFVLCTSHSTVRTALARAVEREAERLRRRDPPTVLVVWDADSLADRLKEHPQLVKEFFGTPWLARFAPDAARAGNVPVPQQLPPLAGEFVNRERDLGRVDSAVVGGAQGAAPLVVLTGGHGVGKTATCRKWAHANAARFSDGQLYADFSALRHRGGVGVGDILSGFLRAFGVPDDVIPHELAERSALFRSSIAGKRVLVVLDDVDHAAQVRPLIPGSADCALLLTSRARLEELVVFDGARLIRLKPLDEPSAQELLARIVGGERIATDPAAVERLVEICGGLPVALRICAARLAANESRPVEWLVGELTDEAVRLERIGTAPGQSLQVVFDDAYRALSAGAAAMYRRAGLHPGPTFTLGAAAAAAGETPERALLQLDELAGAHLIEDLGDRFTFHDLLRLHARGVANREEPREEEDATLRRVVCFYLRAAQRIDHATIPDRLRLTDGPPAPAVGEPSPASSAQAFNCFEAERANIMAALRTAGERRWDDEAWQMGEALFLPYHNHKHPVEAVEVFEIATEAARRAGSTEAEVRMLSQLAFAHLDIGDLERAREELAQCRTLIEHSPHRELWGSIREWTGRVESAAGNYADAISFYQQARDAFEAAGNPRGVALQEMGMGRARDRAGDHRGAVACILRATELLDPHADTLTTGRAFLYLGEAYCTLGDRALARPALVRAVELLGGTGAPLHEARALEALAQVERDESDSARAAQHLRRALAIYVAISSPAADRVGARLDELASEHAAA